MIGTRMKMNEIVFLADRAPKVHRFDESARRSDVNEEESDARARGQPSNDNLPSHRIELCHYSITGTISDCLFSSSLISERRDQGTVRPFR